jgi:hypothetical protein
MGGCAGHGAVGAAGGVRASFAPDLGDQAQTRGAPYADRAFPRAGGCAANPKYAFWASKVPAGRQKRGMLSDESAVQKAPDLVSGQIRGRHKGLGEETKLICVEQYLSQAWRRRTG